MAIISIEYELTNNINYDNVIYKFATKKARNPKLKKNCIQNSNTFLMYILFLYKIYIIII